MMKHTRVLLAATLSLALLVPSSASADWLFTPYIGGNAGGDALESQTNFGVSAGWMGRGIFGFEFDAGWAPNALDQGQPDAFTLINDSSVSTYMFNAILGAPVGDVQGMSVRPYGSFGLGAIHVMAESDFGLIDANSTNFGWNAGGGAMGFFNEMWGLRGDVRYFRSMDDLAESPLTDGIDRFGFWRVTGGLVFRFGRGSTP